MPDTPEPSGERQQRFQEIVADYYEAEEAGPPPDRDAWRALVEKTLKGAAPGTLERRTLEGLAIRPLYDAADAPALPKSAPSTP